MASSPVGSIVSGKSFAHFPEAAGPGARAAMPDLLVQAHLAEGAGRVAEVVLQDVGVVDAGVER